VGEAGSVSIALRRSGGILPRRVLETHTREQDLEPQEAERLRALVAAGDLDRLAARSPITGPGADMYQYDLRVDDGHREHRILISGTAIPEELRSLIELLEDAGGRRGRP